MAVALAPNGTVASGACASTPNEPQKTTKTTNVNLCHLFTENFRNDYLILKMAKHLATEVNRNIISLRIEITLHNYPCTPKCPSHNLNGGTVRDSFKIWRGQPN
jgi:hypothetical protein